MFDSRKHLYLFLMFLFSLFVLYSLQQTYLSNSLLKIFDSFWLSFSDKKTTGTCSFVYFIVKTILLEIASSLSTPATKKMICPFKFQLSFAINQYISSDLQSCLDTLMTQQLLCFLRFHLLHLQLFFIMI